MADSNPEGTVTVEESTARQLGLLESEETNQEIEAEYVEEDAEPVDDNEQDDDPDANLESADDGQDEEINAEELEADRMRLADYTRKTQELARERAEFQNQLQAVQHERQLYAQYLGQLANANQPQRPDFDAIAKEEGFEQAMRARVHYENQMEQYNALTTEQQEAQRRLQAQAAESKAIWQREQNEILLNALPEWKDEEVYAREAGEIADYALERGFTQDQLADVSALEVQILRESRLYRESQDKVRGLKPSTGKVLRPGAKGQIKGKSRSRKARERYAKSGTVEDGAEALRSIFGGS